MAMVRSLSVLLFVLGVGSGAHANGKFFPVDDVPAGVPYQRALILHDGTTECMILQSAFQIPGGAATADLAWVVPVPDVPELGAMPVLSAEVLFLRLAMLTRASVTRLWPIVLGGSIALLFAAGLLALWGHARSERTKWPRWDAVARDRAHRVAVRAVFWGVVSLLCTILVVPNVMTGASGTHGVEVVQHEQVGIYDVHVIKGRDATAVMDWLETGGYHFDASDRAVFDRYVAQGWYFVAAKVRTDEEPSGGEVLTEGLAAPLVLRFSVSRAVYPMALTATAGQSTEVLVYVVSSSKVDCGPRLRTAHSEWRSDSWADLHPIRDVHGFSPDRYRFLRHLTKFKGTMKPAEMADDLIFEPAPDNVPVREHVAVW